ncbi:hypothetical protein FOCC_FOCC010701, partial [Frankliniella occidentalis]
GGVSGGSQRCRQNAAPVSPGQERGTGQRGSPNNCPVKWVVYTHKKYRRKKTLTNVPALSSSHSRTVATFAISLPVHPLNDYLRPHKCSSGPAPVGSVPPGQQRRHGQTQAHGGPRRGGGGTGLAGPGLAVERRHDGPGREHRGRRRPPPGASGARGPPAGLLPRLPRGDDPCLASLHPQRPLRAPPHADAGCSPRRVVVGTLFAAKVPVPVSAGAPHRPRPALQATFLGVRRGALVGSSDTRVPLPGLCCGQQLGPSDARVHVGPLHLHDDADGLLPGLCRGAAVANGLFLVVVSALVYLGGPGVRRALVAALLLPARPVSGCIGGTPRCSGAGPRGPPPSPPLTR